MHKLMIAVGATSALISFASSAGAANPDVIFVRDGCGLGAHRGPLGLCRPNGIPVRTLRSYTGGACPPTYHLGPFGNRCRSDF